MSETAETIAAGPAQAVAAASQTVSEATEEFDPNTLITALVLIAILLAVIVAAQVYMRYQEQMQSGDDDDSEED